ncbi:MAG: hypothetical protein IVW53_15385 [Chloroflexi bacterium]|nr:hypothetical protein [Chloroflexota bacterium]
MFSYFSRERREARTVEQEEKLRRRGTFSITVLGGRAASKAINRWTSRGWVLQSNIPSGLGPEILGVKEMQMTLVFKWPAEQSVTPATE